MREHDDAALAAEVRRYARPLTGRPQDFAPLLSHATRAELILIGEASHGTHEFYRIRAEITKALIRAGQISAVMIEADWPDAWRVHRYVTGRADADLLATDALAGFRRFPQWMWRNADVLDFVGWLRAHNDRLPLEQRVGFFGMDLYSLHASIEAVVQYLERVDPGAAERARTRYRCLDAGGGHPQRYGRLAALGLTPSCEREVLAQLVELQTRVHTTLQQDGLLASEDRFFAEQNARLIRNAERYYRALYDEPAASWNVRDRHMMELIRELVDFLRAEGRAGSVVVWAHNSHLGDARATEMRRRGEVNVGQLAREQFGRAACLVGFTSYTGTVTAAQSWDDPGECMRVRPAVRNSYEALFHDVAGGNGAHAPCPDFLLDLTMPGELVEALRAARLQRAIGVIYRPATERQSHYLYASLPEQFDFVLHIDRTRAVEPLEHAGTWTPLELPETYPTAV